MLKQLIQIADYFPYCLTIVDMRDATRPCIHANSRFLENTGYPAEEALGRNLSFLQGELTAKDTVEFMQACFKNKQACIQDIINYKKDGTPFLNRLLMVPIERGREYFYIGVQNDITAHRGLSYFNDSLRDVADGEIRHTVLNPLAIIFGKLEKITELSGRAASKKDAEIVAHAFQRINEYCLEIESISEFKNFDPEEVSRRKS